jgi:DNA invertase Pin-like site-specific DNA recombinase
MKTIIYVRVSTNKQDTDSQRLELINVCKLRGWNDFEVIEDVISGGKDQRPGLDALMSQIRAGKVARVVCYKLDRLARSVIHLAMIARDLETYQVALIIPGQSIDTSYNNPAGRLQMNMLSAVAEFERDLIRERVKAGIEAAKAKGVRLGRRREHSVTPEQVKDLRDKGLAWREVGRKLKIDHGTARRLYPVSC